MKCQIERAKPSNILDIYALFKKAAKEGIYPEILNEDNIKDYYFRMCDPMNGELVNPYHVFLLARRGRQYLGYLHAYMTSKPKSNKNVMFLELIYIDPKKRKLGVAKQLLDQFLGDCKKMKIPSIELLCKDELVPYWSKKKAVKTCNAMRIDL